MGGFPSGQREQTVNLPSPTSVVRIHLLPPNNRHKRDGYFFARIGRQQIELLTTYLHVLCNCVIIVDKINSNSSTVGDDELLLNSNLVQEIMAL